MLYMLYKYVYINIYIYIYIYIFIYIYIIVIIFIITYVILHIYIIQKRHRQKFKNILRFFSKSSNDQENNEKCKKFKCKN